jgi:chemotaxis response regulator CheB
MEQSQLCSIKGTIMSASLVQETPVDKAPAALPVVCIGISLGGLQPLTTIFRGLPSNTGMAFVVLHHVRRRPTLLPEILRGCTSMPVLIAADDLPIRPDHVYVLSSGTEMTLTDGRLMIRPVRKAAGWSTVITTFLLSLANSRHPGVAIILSGLDEDGTAALTALKRHGGITIAQELSSAKEPDMPRSAVSTGAVDYELAPEAIAPLLESIATRYRQAKGAKA